MSDRAQLRYLTRDEVRIALDHIDVVEVIAEVLQLHAYEEVALPAEAYLAWVPPGGGRARSLNMPSYVGGPFGAVGTKIINANPDNTAAGSPRASGLTLLFDPVTAAVTAIMDASLISATRTAAVSALAAQVSAAETPATALALLGAGALADAHVDLLPRHLGALREVVVYDRERCRAEEFAARWRPTLASRDVTIRVAPDAEDAVRSAGLVVPVTTTTCGYIPYRWLQPGSVVVHVSLDDLMPEVVILADSVIVDDWPLIRDDTHRLLGRMYRAGQLGGPDGPEGGGRRVDAELGDVLSGARPARHHADGIVVVNPFGMSIEDVALASRVQACAVERGLGCLLDR